MKMLRKSKSWRIRVLALVTMAVNAVASAEELAAKEPSGTGAPASYQIQPGDVLRVSVWKEPDLQQDLLVRPDGAISLPLAGELLTHGRTVSQIQAELVARIEEYIPDPVVTVQVVNTDGNAIFVLGKVQRPGAYVMNRPLDVTQALALAGGMAVFAEENSISILRRIEGKQNVLPFSYGDVQYGRDLEQNVLLEPGDVVVVP